MCADELWVESNPYDPSKGAKITKREKERTQSYKFMTYNEIVKN